MQALRSVVSAVAGYAAMAVAVFLGTAAAWAALGAEGAFQAGTTEASTAWSAAMCVFGGAAGIVGGAVAATVGGRGRRMPVRILAGLVLAVGLAVAVYQTGAERRPMPQDKRPADLTYLEAGAVARSPTWYDFTIPLIGAAGAMLGGRIVSSRTA